MKIKIYYHHTDCGGVVYYANYLKFLEEARSEFFEKRGIFIKALTEKGTLFVVARQEIDYKLPAFYADILEVQAQLSDISGVRLEFTQKIENQQHQEIAAAKTILVCVDKNFKPKAIPAEVCKKLS
jgi:acyl-CoA thioester hydrolase